MNAHLPSPRTSAAGFSLIELMVTVAIATILISIAIPAYNTQIRKSRRTEAKTACEVAEEHADDPAQQEDEHQNHQAADPRRHAGICEQAAQVRFDTRTEFPGRPDGDDPKNQRRGFAHEPAH